MIDAPAIMNRIFPVLGYHYQAQTGGRAVPLPSLADWPHPYPHRHAPGIFFCKKIKVSIRADQRGGGDRTAPPPPAGIRGALLADQLRGHVHAGERRRQLPGVLATARHGPNPEPAHIKKDPLRIH
jgi:hypothetical protein